LSVSNEFLTHLPVLEFSDTTTIALSRGGTTTATLTATISSKTGVGIDQDLIDGEFRVEVNHLFLGLTGEAPDIVHTDNIAIYRYPAGFGDTSDSVSASIQLFLKSFSDTTFDTFSTSGGTYIRTFVKVTGINSGLTQNIEVQIEKGS
jgi:hypothetical protein